MGGLEGLTLDIKAAGLGAVTSLGVVLAYLATGFLGDAIGLLKWSEMGPHSGLFVKGVCSFAGFYGGYVSGRYYSRHFTLRGAVVGLFTVLLSVASQRIEVTIIDPTSLLPPLVSTIVGAHMANPQLRR